MTTAIMRSTQIQFNLTVNVNVNADKTLLLLAALMTLPIYQVARAKHEMSLLWGDFTEALGFTSKVYVIGFKSLAWGFVGVRL
jgi:hypothetical protein